MPRVRDIKNQWGTQGGPNPQRSDLWQVDLDPVVTGLNQQDAFAPRLQALRRFIPTAISLPELRVRAEAVRRDSRSYNMPSWDEPLDAIRLSLVMDDAGSLIRTSNDIPQSEVYRVLDVWRRLVRTGRGAVGAEPSARLNVNYSITFRFPIYLYLCRGYSLPPVSATAQTTAVTRTSAPRQSIFDNTASSRELTPQTQVASNQALLSSIDGLEVTNVICLENAWLSGFKLGDLSYDQVKVLTIDAMLYAENILQMQPGNNLPTTL